MFQSNTSRLNLFKNQGFFSSDLRGATVTRALSPRDHIDALGLVHDSFVDQGYILPRPSGIRLRSHDIIAETSTFIAQHDGKIVGVNSLIPDSKGLGLPSDVIFSEEINRLRSEGHILCEGSNECLLKPFRRSGLRTEMFRSSFAHAMESGATHLLLSASPTQRVFYEIIYFSQIGDKKVSDPTTGDSVILMCLNIKELKDWWDSPKWTGSEIDELVRSYFYDDNPYIEKVADWAQLASSSLSAESAVREILAACPEFLKDTSPEELAALSENLGMLIGVSQEIHLPSVKSA